MGRTSDFNPATTVALHDVLFFYLSPDRVTTMKESSGY